MFRFRRTLKLQILSELRHQLLNTENNVHSNVYSNERGCIIIFNRDEKITRERALPPTEYHIEGKNHLPKRPKSRWHLDSTYEETKIVVLLNGAQEKHLPKPNYRKKRLSSFRINKLTENC